MNPQIFFDHFERLADAPNAVARLREMILQLAVQGKLVEQDERDEPATRLLERIEVERKRLVKEKRLKEAKPLPPVLQDETPFALPQGWMWARFGDVATIASNLVQPDSYPDSLHVAPDNIEKQTGRLFACRTVKEDEVRSANHLFYSGQIIYSKIRPNLAKVTIVDFDGLCSADMYPINAHIDAVFLLKYMLSSIFLSMAVKGDTRVAMPKINQEELNKILVAVPPLDEQKRIVAKVDELMQLCDELEHYLVMREESRENLLRIAIRDVIRHSKNRNASSLLSIA